MRSRRGGEVRPLENDVTISVRACGSLYKGRVRDGFGCRTVYLPWRRRAVGHTEHNRPLLDTRPIRSRKLSNDAQLIPPLHPRHRAEQTIPHRRTLEPTTRTFSRAPRAGMIPRCARIGAGEPGSAAVYRAIPRVTKRAPPRPHHGATHSARPPIPPPHPHKRLRRAFRTEARRVPSVDAWT